MGSRGSRSSRSSSSTTSSRSALYSGTSVMGRVSGCSLPGMGVTDFTTSISHRKGRRLALHSCLFSKFELNGAIREGHFFRTYSAKRGVYVVNLYAFSLPRRLYLTSRQIQINGNAKMGCANSGILKLRYNNMAASGRCEISKFPRRKFKGALAPGVAAPPQLHF